MNLTKEWLVAAAVRAVKTVAQTAVAVLTTATVMGDVNWAMLGSSCLLAGILSACTSLVGLPEVQK